MTKEELIPLLGACVEAQRALDTVTNQRATAPSAEARIEADLAYVLAIDTCVAAEGVYNTALREFLAGEKN